MKELSRCHSLIDSNYDNNIFTLLKKCKFVEVTIRGGEYLFIPKKWFHCVETKGRTLGLNYCFKLKEIINNNNSLLQHIKKNIPYKNKFDLVKINYDEFIKENYPDENRTLFLVGDNKFINVVKKPRGNDNYNEYFNLKEAIDYEKFSEKYLYKARQGGSSKYNKIEILSKILNFNNILNDCELENLSSINSAWFTLGKEVSSGLHNDLDDNIMFVAEGEKKILLGSPKCHKYLYVGWTGHNKNINLSRKKLLLKYYDEYIENYDSYEKKIILDYKFDSIYNYLNNIVSLLYLCIKYKIKLKIINNNYCEKYLKLKFDKFYVNTKLNEKHYLDDINNISKIDNDKNYIITNDSLANLEKNMEDISLKYIFDFSDEIKILHNNFLLKNGIKKYDSIEISINDNQNIINDNQNVINDNQNIINEDKILKIKNKDKNLLLFCNNTEYKILLKKKLKNIITIENDDLEILQDENKLIFNLVELYSMINSEKILNFDDNYSHISEISDLFR